MSDTRLVSQSWGFHNFNPRSPRGGATRANARIRECKKYFNPRSPRGGATGTGMRMADSPMNFNPRSPRGGATHQMDICSRHHQFQSTLPTRGSDQSARRSIRQRRISIHAPHEGERRCPASQARFRLYHFNPRSPRGGATADAPLAGRRGPISIHAPHEGERRQKSF